MSDVRVVSRYSMSSIAVSAEKSANQQRMDAGCTSAKPESNATRRTSPAIPCQGTSEGSSKTPSTSTAKAAVTVRSPRASPGSGRASTAKRSAPSSVSTATGPVNSAGQVK